MNVAVTPVQLAKKRNQAKINLWLIDAKITEIFFIVSSSTLFLTNFTGMRGKGRPRRSLYTLS